MGMDLIRAVARVVAPLVEVSSRQASMSEVEGVLEVMVEPNSYDVEGGSLHYGSDAHGRIAVWIPVMGSPILARW